MRFPYFYLSFLSAKRVNGKRRKHIPSFYFIRRSYDAFVSDATRSAPYGFSIKFYPADKFLWKNLVYPERIKFLPLKLKNDGTMRAIRDNDRRYKPAISVLKLLSAGIALFVIIQFFRTISPSALYIIIGIILSWRIWEGLFRLAWLLIRIAIVMGIIYLLIA